MRFRLLERDALDRVTAYRTDFRRYTLKHEDLIALLDGVLDDVRIWKYDLSSAEILWLATDGAGEGGGSEGAPQAEPGEDQPQDDGKPGEREATMEKVSPQKTEPRQKEETPPTTAGASSEAEDDPETK